MNDRRVNVGRVDEFEVGKCRIIDVAGTEIGVVRLASGEFHAIRNRCPHKGAPICKGVIGGTWPPSGVGELQFAHEGEVIVCPWHGYEYDVRTGVELFQERPTRLRKYRTEVEGGCVVLTM